MPRLLFYRTFAAFVAIFLAEGSAFAPANDSSPGIATPVAASGKELSPVGLEALVAEVLEKNPELKFYKAEIDAAKGIRTAAGTWANPELRGGIGQKKVWNEDEELTGKGRAAEVSITQTFEWPGRTALRRAIAGRDARLAELGFEQFRASLAARTRIKAYELFAKREVAAATLEVADHFRSLREVLVQRSPAGLTPLLETRVIEAMDLSIQRKATEASLAAGVAQLELNHMRGAAVPDEFLSLGRMEVAFHPLKKRQEELLELAGTNAFTVREHALRLEQRNLEVGLTENERLPAVSVGPSFSTEHAGERERVIAAVVSLPLPVWNHNQGNIAASKARRSQAEALLETAQHEVEHQAIEAMLTYNAKFKEMASWQADSVQHFKEAAGLADRHYRLGAVPVSVYVELQTQYLEVIAGLYGTRLEALEAAARLEILTGTRLSLIDESVAGERK